MLETQPGTERRQMSGQVELLVGTEAPAAFTVPAERARILVVDDDPRNLFAVDYVLKPVDPLILKSKVAVFAELFAMTQEVRRKAEQERRLLEENLRVRTEKLQTEEQLRRA